MSDKKKTIDKKKAEQKHAYIEYAIVAVMLLFCEWFFFRNIIGMDAMIGDRGDGRL